MANSDGQMGESMRVVTWWQKLHDRRRDLCETRFRQSWDKFVLGLYKFTKFARGMLHILPA